MPIYLMLTTLTDEGRRIIKEDPDRLKEINKEVELMGIKIIDQYALLGQHDFVNILEAPSNEAVARLSVELSARGTMSTMTMAAMTLDDFINYLKKKPTQAPW
ncbi:MAG: GYD domain-containing protein [Chloroflexota bacterium]|nr:GYD domain-containing protein [Chloroflexota bacterium]